MKIRNNLSKPMFANQREAYNKLVLALNDNKKFIVLEGNTGSGKKNILANIMHSTLIESESIVYGECKALNEEVAYSTLRELKLKNSSRLNLSLGFSVSSIFGLSVSLSPKEQNEYNQAKNYIAKLIRKGKAYIIIDNISNCDPTSLLLLNEVKEEHKNSDKLYIIVTVNSEEKINTHVKKFLEDFLTIKMRQPTENEFKEMFSLFLRTKSISDINDKILELLYKNCYGNISHIKLLAKAYDEGQIKFDDEHILDRADYLKDIIYNRLGKLAESESLINALKYGSIIGMQFPIPCIQLIINNAEDVLHKAENLDLIKIEIPYAEFFFKYLRDVFSLTNEDTKSKFYKKLIESYKLTYPQLYDVRAYLANQIKETDYSSLMTTLHCIQKLKRNNVFDRTVYDNISCACHSKFFNKYYEAWKHLFNNRYEDAINCLNHPFEKIDKELIAEKDILISLASIKHNNQSYRVSALNNIRAYENERDVNDEKDVWNRLMIRKLNLLIHCGEYAEAGILAKRLLNSLSASTTNSENEFLFNILKRKANSFLSYDFCIKPMEEAVEYFKGDNEEFPKYLKQYYIALNNYAAILGEHSKWAEAEEIINKITVLIDSFPTFVFPRKYIYLHNKLLIDYFSENANIDSTIKQLANYLDQREASADKNLLRANLAVLYAIDLNYSEAKKQLEVSMSECTNDYEGIYDFCITYNSAIIDYLLGEGIDKIITNLQAIEIPHIADASYLAKKIECAKKLVVENNERFDGKKWLNAILEKNPNYQLNETWNFYGLGYDLNLIYDWDDD